MPSGTMDSLGDGQLVDVGGYRLWMRHAGPGSPTVVFESGAGDDSSVWTSVEPEIRRRKEAATVLYDRAGLGRSELKEGPYRIEDEVAALRQGLTACGAESPLVLVAHSYGGFVSLLTATLDSRVAGLVLVDSNMPGFFTPAQVERLLRKFREIAPIMAPKDPKGARVMLPLMEALPETARCLRELRLPSSIPVIDIVAERVFVEDPEEVEAIRREHATFVTAAPEREAVFAAGSGHYVMRDRPELVVEAVGRLIDRVRAGPGRSA